MERFEVEYGEDSCDVRVFEEQDGVEIKGRAGCASSKKYLTGV